jgi:hypothetical protein
VPDQGLEVERARTPSRPLDDRSQGDDLVVMQRRRRRHAEFRTYLLISQMISSTRKWELIGEQIQTAMRGLVQELGRELHMACARTDRRLGT